MPIPIEGRIGQAYDASVREHSQYVEERKGLLAKSARSSRDERRLRFLNAQIPILVQQIAALQLGIVEQS